MADFIPFGTDGVRGIANEELMPDFVQRLGYNAGVFFYQKYGKGKILIGMDTRLSCSMLEHALASGLCSAGVDVELLGVIPTPGVAYLTRYSDARAGAVISASHNPAIYNGIKFFGSEGFKLTESEEERIEELIKIDHHKTASSERIGRSEFNHNAKNEYEKHLINSINIDLTGLNIGIDCANGATYKLASETISRLGAHVKVLNNSPDGSNINANCGSTHLNGISDFVVREKLDLGLAFDGDGDRVIAIDEAGQIVDGDFIMAICANRLHEKGGLVNNSVVVTTMTNLGFDLAMKKKGINVIKSDVGDRFVLEQMIKNNVIIGGEQSGHIIFMDHATTGDGIISGLKLLEAVKDSGKPLSELMKIMERLPQKLINVMVKDKDETLDSDLVKKAKDSISNRLGESGRLLLRASGTEPLIRVMVEAETEGFANDIAIEMAEVVVKASRGAILV